MPLLSYSPSFPTIPKHLKLHASPSGVTVPSVANCPSYSCILCTTCLLSYLYLPLPPTASHQALLWPALRHSAHPPPFWSPFLQSQRPPDGSPTPSPSCSCNNCDLPEVETLPWRFLRAASQGGGTQHTLLLQADPRILCRFGGQSLCSRKSI